MDTSRKRKPTNLSQINQNPFTGRKTLIFELIEEIMNVNTRIINVHGPEGIGKTRLVIEGSIYMNDREAFKDGIFYIDLMGV
jgi:hypothetical protein